MFIEIPGQGPYSGVEELPECRQTGLNGDFGRAKYFVIVDPCSDQN